MNEQKSENSKYIIDSQAAKDRPLDDKEEEDLSRDNHSWKSNLVTAINALRRPQTICDNGVKQLQHLWLDILEKKHLTQPYIDWPDLNVECFLGICVYDSTMESS